MTKRPLILLHAALGSQAQLKALVPLLSIDFEVHTLDFEGHGARSSKADFSIDRFTDNTLVYLQENKIEQADIFGYSMGGYVALNLAQKHPERVGSIFTLGTKFNWSTEAAERETKMLNPEVIAQKVPHFAEKLRLAHPGNDWKEVLTKTAEMMLGLAAGKKLSDQDFNQIQHRVLIGIGSLDKMVSIEESEQVALQLGNAQSSTIDGFHHAIEKNDAEVLAKMITDFVNLA